MQETRWTLKLELDWPSLIWQNGKTYPIRMLQWFWYPYRCLYGSFCHRLPKENTGRAIICFSSNSFYVCRNWRNLMRTISMMFLVLSKSNLKKKMSIVIVTKKATTNSWSFRAQSNVSQIERNIGTVLMMVYNCEIYCLIIVAVLQKYGKIRTHQHPAIEWCSN